MIVHPLVADPTSGFNVALRQEQAQRWHDSGYSVCPIPADGREHTVSTRTPKVCTTCAVTTDDNKGGTLSS